MLRASGAALAEVRRLGSWEVDSAWKQVPRSPLEAPRWWCPRYLLGEKRRTSGASPIRHCCRDSPDCFFLSAGPYTLLFSGGPAPRTSLIASWKSRSASLRKVQVAFIPISALLEAILLQSEMFGLSILVAPSCF